MFKMMRKKVSNETKFKVIMGQRTVVVDIKSKKIFLLFFLIFIRNISFQLSLFSHNFNIFSWFTLFIPYKRLHIS